MLGNITIRARIWVLLALACLAALILGGVSLFSLQRTGDLQDRAAAVQQARAALYRSQVSQQSFLRTSDPGAAEAARQALDRAGEALAGIQENGRQASALVKKVEELGGIFDRVVQTTQQMNQSLARQTQEAKKLLGHVRQEVVAKVEANRAQAIIMAENPDPNEDTLLGLGYILLADMEHLQLAFSRLLTNQDLEAFQADRQAVLESVQQNLKNLKSLLPSLKDQDLAEAAGRMPAMIQSLLENLDSLVQQWQEREKLVGSLKGVAGQMTDAMDGYTSRTRETISATRGAILQITLVVALGAIILVLVLGGFISRGINRALRRTAHRMGRGADQVASASEQVSGASQSLAEGSAQQAASLEETSSSLEEMSSMTKNNAANAGEAKRVMEEEVSANFQELSQHTRQMQSTMAETVAAGEETTKIVKSIDEIAFQTNLLALNAAVEAARAGEAGAGFAVVADEVRNLAMRAAEAAKSTQELIERSGSKTREAAELLDLVAQALEKNQELGGKVAGLVAEIAAASDEQAQGITQINQAAGEMDKVTQQVAANAEESAAAAQQLNGQAQELQGMVGELLVMVEGAGGRSAGRQPEEQPPAAEEKETRRLPAPEPAGGSRSRRRHADRRFAPPDEEDADFADF